MICESNYYNNYAADHNSIRRKNAYGLYTLVRLSGLCLGGNLCQIYDIRRHII